MAGTLDEIYSRIQGYMGDFLSSRQQLIDAGKKIDAALAQAQASGSTTIGEKTYTLADLQNLKAENQALLNQNADLMQQITDFKAQYDAVVSGATEAFNQTGEMQANDLDYPYTGMLYGGMGALPAVAVPAAYLVAAGVVLASTVYLFLGNVKTHLGAVAGQTASNVLTLALIGGGLYFAYKMRWI